MKNITHIFIILNDLNFLTILHIYQSPCNRYNLFVVSFANNAILL